MASCPHCGADAKHWIQSAVKHPGSETAAAKRHGLSTAQEAKHEAGSSNPHIATRGRLAERFISKKL